MAGLKFVLHEQEKDTALSSLNTHYHMTERIAYIAVEKGSGMFQGGVRFEVGSGTSFDHNWRSVAFAPPYGTAPLFLADLQTMTGPDPAALRYRNRTAGGVELQVAEDQSWDVEIWHMPETVGYVCIGWLGSGVVLN